MSRQLTLQQRIRPSQWLASKRTDTYRAYTMDTLQSERRESWAVASGGCQKGAPLVPAPPESHDAIKIKDLFVEAFPVSGARRRWRWAAEWAWESILSRSTSIAHQQAISSPPPGRFIHFSTCRTKSVCLPRSQASPTVQIPVSTWTSAIGPTTMKKTGRSPW
jgi:hypothetical protein